LLGPGKFCRHDRATLNAPKEEDRPSRQLPDGCTGGASEGEKMNKAPKCAFYQFCKCLGLFALARRLTAKQLRILCYHGLSIDDEHLYSPSLFMRAETIRSRLKTLVRGNYPVLPLGEAIEALRSGNLPPCATVITYDDGFYGNFRGGATLFREFPLPTTFYVTTYYVTKQSPIFRHAVQYLFWKTTRPELHLEGLPGVPEGVLDLRSSSDVRARMWQLIRHGETSLDEAGRVSLCKELACRLGVDYDALARSRKLGLMTLDEIRTLAGLGVDIQLHTHRHRFPPDEADVHREIADNRAVLEPLLNRKCNHLCYPSGVFQTEQWPWLETEGIVSAVTCEVGMNSRSTPRYGLRRFLDSESVHAIEFEAELAGFSEILRRFRRLLGKQPAPSANLDAQGH